MEAAKIAPSHNGGKILSTAQEKPVAVSTRQEVHSQGSSEDGHPAGGPEYPTDVKLFTILMSLGVSTFLVALASLNRDG